MSGAAMLAGHKKTCWGSRLRNLNGRWRRGEVAPTERHPTDSPTHLSPPSVVFEFSFFASRFSENAIKSRTVGYKYER